jgi:hypothetical protein
MLFEAVKYQALIFGDYQDIKPEPTTIQKLFNDLIKFNLVPGTTNNEFDISRGQMISSLKFSTIDNQLIISFKNNFIQVEMYKINTKPLPTLEDFSNLVKQIFSEIEKIYPRLSNRMSFLTNYINENLSNTNKDSLYERIFSDTASLIPTLPYEWTHRVISRFERMINKSREMLNHVVTLNRGYTNFNPNVINIVQNTGKLNRIEITLDINSIPENRGLRFSNADFTFFLTEVVKWNNEIFEQTIKKISYNGNGSN